MSSDYFLEIESHFARRRGTPFMVSPKDWALMKKWAEEGIPLPVVIEALDGIFDKQDAKGKKVNGLHFCRHAVKELWDERRELQIGSETIAPEESPAPRLDALAAALGAYPDFAEQVGTLIRERSVPRIEEALMELETRLIDQLAATAPQLRAEAEALAVGADEKVRARSTDAHLRRLVREHFGIPRLTLF
ncbi:MAG: hypothetical protein ABI779_11240 [Acidobacteriota bacterium]